MQEDCETVDEPEGAIRIKAVPEPGQWIRRAGEDVKNDSLEVPSGGEGIVINIFLLQSYSQTSEDIRFARRLAETTKGRVFFTAGNDLDRFVVWDYVNRRKSIIG